MEGSVIAERHDANALAYKSDVTAKKLLSGSVPPPLWAMELIKTLEHCTGPPGGRSWIQDGGGEQGYAFGGMASFDAKSTRRKTTDSVSSFPPASWGRGKDGGSYFHDDPAEEQVTRMTRPDSPLHVEESDPTTFNFPTRFESDMPSYAKHTRKSEPYTGTVLSDPLDTPRTHSSSKSLSMLPPSYSSNPFSQSQTRSQTTPFVSPQPDAVAHAIAQFDFKAIEVFRRIAHNHS